ncbi:hypothetical protein HYPBUDRAFT_156159 [Hyphopichia burtonii NRRL Y-1933]|uniref:Nuclear segregation protein n=1 Tax=Hyphopichia burtonii NRRL Y-1933 TaxID=984485 RepID=A0A1E4RPP9_9ASCO|nr:hypothetical protein HYPBUDRAFT_156159 [Hyphopichia burtonii NRRL Y-1933]ODV69181.1 hypothetical protein HYPBUDRAFT_156159 [Hyphopichia burtonii NRRL Y-1933]
MSAATASAASGAGAPRRFVKRPDDKAFKEQIETLKKGIKELDISYQQIHEKINKTTSDPKLLARRKQLQAELKELVGKQGNIKQERLGIQEQIKQVDNVLKRKITELNQQTAKNNFKSVGEIDARINSLDKLVDQGDLKLADERRFIKEMSQLRKLKKDFGSIEKQQESIDKDKAKIAELKTKLNSIQNKEIQSRFEQVSKELDELNQSNSSITSKRDELFSKRNSIKKEKDAKYDAIRKLRSEFDAEFEVFKTKLAEEKKKREEETKQQRILEKQQKRKELASKQLADASIPAFTEEINQIHLLLSYFDPSYVKPAPKKTNGLPVANASSTNNNNIRKVEMPSDAVIIKKEQPSFFEGKGKKKGKKSHSSKSKAFTVDPDVIVTLTDLSIPLPTKAEDVPTTITVLKETLKSLEDKQDEQTKTNIEKAKAKIAQLEKEDEENDDQDDEN